MDWDHTNPTCNWDTMNKLELQDNNNYHQQHYGGAFVSSSDHQSASVMNNMFSVDLKLGTLEDMSDLSVDNTVKNSEELSMNMGSSQQISGSSRTRGRGRNSAGAQTVVYCSVDGCNSDLSQCREYHRRHRVCERHSKTPVVLIAGKEQRFCQQCSRFHSLGEFDEVKRSCRKRLDGHNRRRRKTQPQNFYINSGSLHSSNTGNGLMQFRNLQMHTSSPWPVLPQPDQKAPTMYNHYDPLASLSDNLSWSTICTRSNDHHPLLTNCATLTAPTSSCNSKGAIKVSEPGISLTQASHSECALSLLSRHPARSSGLYNPTTHTTHQARSSPLGFGSTLHLNDGFAQFSGTQAMEDESSASLSSTSNDNSGHSFGGFLTGQDGFCTNTSSRVFPFTWG